MCGWICGRSTVMLAEKLADRRETDYCLDAVSDDDTARQLNGLAAGRSP